jgi:hypothetical protein
VLNKAILLREARVRRCAHATRILCQSAVLQCQGFIEKRKGLNRPFCLMLDAYLNTERFRPSLIRTRGPKTPLDCRDHANSDSNLEYNLGNISELLDPMDLDQLSGH